MSTFVDTPALLALLDGDDRLHAEAASQWRRLVTAGEPLVTTNYVLVETFTLARRRLGHEAARVLQTAVVPLLRVIWIGLAEHDAAVEALLTAGGDGPGLVDCTSRLIMRHQGVGRCFTFDERLAERNLVSASGDP